MVLVLIGKLRGILNEYLKEDLHYVETRACKEAKDILDDCGFVTIYGNEGDGKTSMAVHLLAPYVKGCGPDKIKYEGLILRTPEEWTELVNSDKHQVIVIDDVFGMCNFERRVLLKWLVILNDMQRVLQSSNRKTLVIFTAKVQNILEVYRELRRYAFFREINVANLCSTNLQLNEEEKIRIVQEYAETIHVAVDLGDIMSFIKCHGSLHGFPFFVKMYVNAYSLKQPPNICIDRDIEDDTQGLRI